MASKYPDLTGFKALSFDCYGTLVDWESGFLRTLRLLTSQLPPTHPLNTEPPTEALRRLHALTTAHERAQPSALYNEILASSLTAFAHELRLPLADSIAEPFGNSPGTWPAFADTRAGLRKLARRYRLVILSNVDNANIAGTLAHALGDGEDGEGEGVRFDAVYTAQDIGAYKPSHKNFEYLFAHAREDLGVDKEKGELLHVACSLRADHVPAKELGLRSVWIARGADRKGDSGIGGDVEALRGQTAFEWKFDTIGEFADEVERQFAVKEKS
ncbi:haloacid dehalogenase [Whalleya microplaca]|nr:haloacid dehalogenase [Whalleya microplaca]